MPRLIIFTLLCLAATAQYTCVSGYTWYSLNNQCIPSPPICSIGYLWNGRNCLPAIYCPNSTYFDGTACVKGCPTNFFLWRTYCLNCPQSYDLNTTDQSCQVITKSCGNEFYWNGQGCISKVSGNLSFVSSGSSSSGFSSISGSLSGIQSGTSQQLSNSGILISGSASQCQVGYYWNGQQCVLNGGAVVCITGTFWNGYSCVVSSNISTNCTQGYYFNGLTCVINNGRIVCIDGFRWNGFLCQGFLTSTITTVTTNTSSGALCPPGYTPNGLVCVSVCPNGTAWTGAGCVQSTTNRSTTTIVNQTTVINCPSGYFFDGEKCLQLTTYISCIPTFVWNGTSCVKSSLSTQNQSYTVTSNSSQILNFTSTPTQIQIPVPIPTPVTVSTQIPFQIPAPVPTSIPIQIQNQNLNQNQTTVVTNVTTIIQCPPGYYFNGQSCVQLSSTINCIGGFLWNGTTCIYQVSAVTGNLALTNTRQPPPVPTQPSATSLNTTTTTVTTSFECPIGSYFNGGSCVQLSTTIVCLLGYNWNGTSCIRSSANPSQTTSSTTSSSTSTFTNTTTTTTPMMFQCPAGLYFNGLTCVALTGTVSCGGGYFWNGTTCVTSQPNICFPNYIKRDGYCEYYYFSNCSQGTFFNGVTCAPNTGLIGCAVGFTWNTQATQCVRSSTNGFTNSGVNLVTGLSTIPVYGQLPLVTSPIVSPPNSFQIVTAPLVTSPIITSPIITSPIVTAPCPLNQYWNGLQCASGPIQCLPGYIWNGSICSR